MKLTRLVEMIHEDCVGVDDWPVVFAYYRKPLSGEWEEVGDRESVTTVRVDIKAEEVLLIRDAARPPLTVSRLKEELSELMVCHGEFTVDTCESPIVLDGEEVLRIDLPIVGVGRDDQRRIFLVVFASSAE